jgi:hypothetical protein
MAKAVAGKGDVKATKGSTDPPGQVSGSWTVKGDVEYKAYSKLKAGGAEVIHTASCNFEYVNGKLPDGKPAPATVPSSVTLKGSGTRLQGSASGVILDGDDESDSYGNKLAASSSRKLTSS